MTAGVDHVRCATMRCWNAATVRITYTFRGEKLTDDVCGECAESYSRRPALKEFSSAPIGA